jgi:hypothetical protein
MFPGALFFFAMSRSWVYELRIWYQYAAEGSPSDHWESKGFFATDMEAIDAYRRLRNQAGRYSAIDDFRVVKHPGALQGG